MNHINKAVSQLYFHPQPRCLCLSRSLGGYGAELKGITVHHLSMLTSASHENDLVVQLLTYVELTKKMNV